MIDAEKASYKIAWMCRLLAPTITLLPADHELAVVTSHVAFLVAHHSHVRVGDVRPRLGVVAVDARLIARAVPSAPRLRCHCSVPCSLPGPLRVAASPTRGTWTLCTHTGDWFAYLCVLGLILLIGLVFAHRTHPTTARQPQTA